LVVLISSVLTGGAVFHFAVRVFLSASPGTVPVAGALPFRRPRPPLMMFLPGIAFLAVALALGAMPGAAAWAAVAAHTFTDTAGYATTVLLGAEPGPVPNLPGLSHPAEAVLIGLATTCLAAFVGLSGLRRPSRQAAADTGPGTGPNGGRDTRSTRTPPRQSPQLLPRLLDGPMTALRAIHSGEVGDSVAWLTVGAAIFTALFSLLLS
jgi:hypothetical protein